MYHSTNSLLLPSSRWGKGVGWRGPQKSSVPVHVSAPISRFWGNKFAWPNYWTFVGNSGMSADCGVSLVCTGIMAPSSFTDVISFSISPSLTWGLETHRSPNSTLKKKKKLSWTKGNVPCSNIVFSALILCGHDVLILDSKCPGAWGRVGQTWLNHRAYHIPKAQKMVFGCF